MVAEIDVNDLLPDSGIGGLEGLADRIVDPDSNIALQGKSLYLAAGRTVQIFDLSVIPLHLVEEPQRIERRVSSVTTPFFEDTVLSYEVNRSGKVLELKTEGGNCESRDGGFVVNLSAARISQRRPLNSYLNQRLGQDLRQTFPLLLKRLGIDRSSVGHVIPERVWVKAEFGTDSKRELTLGHYLLGIMPKAAGDEYDGRPLSERPHTNCSNLHPSSDAYLPENELAEERLARTSRGGAEICRSSPSRANCIDRRGDRADGIVPTLTGGPRSRETANRNSWWQSRSPCKRSCRMPFTCERSCLCMG